MNRKIYKEIFITMMIIFAASNFTFAQFNMQSLLTNHWGSFDFGLINPPSAIGFGNFTSPTQPLSALHINTNLVTNPFYGSGEVFRTDCPARTTSDPSTAWRLFVNNIEIGNINNSFNFL